MRLQLVVLHHDAVRLHPGSWTDVGIVEHDGVVVGSRPTANADRADSQNAVLEAMGLKVASDRGLVLERQHVRGDDLRRAKIQHDAPADPHAG